MLFDEPIDDLPAQSLVFVLADPETPDVEGSPLERARAARERADSAAPTGRNPTTHPSTTDTAIWEIVPGSNQLLAGVEVDLTNPTDGSVTETVAVDVETVAFATPEPIWNASDNPASRTDVTLAPGATTTLTIAGDGSASVTGTGDASFPDADVTQLPTGRIRSRASLPDSAGLSIEGIRPQTTRALYRIDLDSEGVLRWRGPQGEVRLSMRPDGSVSLPSASVDTAATAGALTTSSGTLTAGQFARSDVDDTIDAIHTQTVNGSYDLTIPRGDGERKRWSSGLGGYALSITGGHGRVADGWNAIYDSANGTWRYVVDNEPAMLTEMDGGEIIWRTAPGGVAGDPITWNTVRYDGQAGSQGVFNFNGATTTGDVWESGPTADRPATPVTGQKFFDTDLGQPVWYNGTDWVDAQGAAV